MQQKAAATEISKVPKTSFFNTNDLKKHFAILLLAGLVSFSPEQAHAEWATGEIRRLDPANSRMTIKHGEIKSLDMPPMTMVFQVRDAKLFEGLKPQDTIEFQAIEENKKYVVTAIRRPAAR